MKLLISLHDSRTVEKQDGARPVDAFSGPFRGWSTPSFPMGREGRRKTSQESKEIASIGGMEVPPAEEGVRYEVYLGPVDLSVRTRSRSLDPVGKYRQNGRISTGIGLESPDMSGSSRSRTERGLLRRSPLCSPADCSLSSSEGGWSGGLLHRNP